MKKRMLTSFIAAAMLGLLLAACGSPSTPGGSAESSSCPSADALQSSLGSGVTYTAGSSQVLEPMGFGELAEATCVYESVGNAGIGDIASVIYISPNSAQGPAFMEKIEELANANGFSADAESTLSGQQIKGENGEFDYFQFDYLTNVGADVVTAFKAFGLEEGDSVILGNITARVDQNG